MSLASGVEELPAIAEEMEVVELNKGGEEETAVAGAAEEQHARSRATTRSEATSGGVRSGAGSIDSIGGSERGSLSVSFVPEPPPSNQLQVHEQAGAGADTKGGSQSQPQPSLSTSASAKGPELQRSASTPPTLTPMGQASEDSALTLRFFKSRRSKAASRLPWEEVSIDEVEEVLGTDRRNGLTQQEAAIRLQRDGQH